jgi:rubrerythrin
MARTKEKKASRQGREIPTSDLHCSVWQPVYHTNDENVTTLSPFIRCANCGHVQADRNFKHPCPACGERRIPVVFDKEKVT